MCRAGSFGGTAHHSERSSNLATHRLASPQILGPVVSVKTVGSSLIYVAIVAMWAGLLIPMWLRRHEQETEVRSVDRFSTAMRILSRRPAPPPDRRYLVMPQRPASATNPVADVPRTAVRRRVPAEARPVHSTHAAARRTRPA